MIESVLLKKIDNKEIREFTIQKDNFTVKILNFGGIIKDIIYDGVDVALGYDTVDEYIKTSEYYGATIGRVCNRIEKGKFTLNGKEYKLAINNGKNSLHGGIKGFNKQIFDYDIKDDKLILTYTSKDMEEGYPGLLKVIVTFFIEDNGINIEYEAKSDCDTLCNLTNHTFFNLNGEGSGSILDHTLQIDADYFLPTDETQIPTSKLEKVKGTPFDFLIAHKVKDRINEDDVNLKFGKGYDHAFVLNNEGFRKVSTLIGDKTNIKMDVYTDQKAIQIYSGNYLNGDKGKNQKLYNYRDAICLETSGYPNAINTPNFPSILLKKGDTYFAKTIYKFYK